MAGKTRPEGWPETLARSRARVLVWELLEAASAPLDARAVYEQLRGCAVSLSSVYRALECFLEHGLVERTALLPGGACYSLAMRGHRHYAVCMGCHKVVAVLDCPLREEPAALADTRFRVTGHELQLYGYCTACDPGETSPHSPRPEKLAEKN